MVVLTELLPGSSSSYHDHRHDVFLNFRGADTRHSFTDHLYSALSRAGLRTFLDDEEIETGEPLKPEVEGAIKSSRASVIVLSQGYASSRWCLEELVLILEQKRSFNQIVIPIFYHVEPSHVRKQRSSFGEAMARHKKRMETETDAEKRNQWAQKMELWERALTQIADLKGEDAHGRRETELIEEVVARIHRRLGAPLSNTLPLLIGMDYYVEFVTSWLTGGSSHSANILTVVGMTGIGKTSLAKYVYQLHSTKFHNSSFIEGINSRCTQSFDELLKLQNQLHGDISKYSPLQVNDVSVYTSKIENALARKRVFVVLDDIGSLDQLDFLLGNKGLHPGSKVIITTKDASLTQRCALFKLKVQPEHTQLLLHALHESGSLELFCIHAFKCNGSIKEGYEDVSKELVKYCQGHPLALEVLGKSLHKKDVALWEDCVRTLKKEPHFGINHALKRTFDSLPSEDNKELFKHIACFFVGTDRDVTETILEACHMNTRSGIKTLIDRCLLSIESNNKLMMHPLIQEMGRDLVRQESPYKPWKRTRLWCHKESYKVLKQKKGSKNLLGLALDMKMLDTKKFHGSFDLKTETLSQMDNLMLLQLNYVHLSGSFVNFPKELRWLCVHGFPLKSMPSDLPMENLVALDMSYSNIESFDVSCSNPQLPGKRQKVTGSCSKDKRLLGSLKILDLSLCKQLLTLAGFSELPALERLILRNCISLVEVCESVEQCVELTLIDMSYCYKLKKVPLSLGKLEKVKTLLLDGCNSLESQVERWDMNSLDISVNSQSSSVPGDLKLFTVFFPSSLKFLSLANNNLSNESFPVDFSSLSMLKELWLDNNPIVSMPNCVRTLPRLQDLSMDYCRNLISIEHPPCTLRVLSISSYKPSLRKIKFDPEMSPLRLRDWELSSDSSTEIDGMVKIQAMASVEETVLDSLGWTNIEFIKESRLKTPPLYGERSTECEAQMYYEFGIFSTIYEGKEMPEWIRCRTEGPSISFTLPSSSKKLRGFNFCCVEMYAHNSFKIPTIKISNITKNHTWIYCHYIDELRVGEEGCLSLLSHWMFGENEMKGGDHIIIDVAHHDDYRYRGQVTKECGIGLVYDEDGKTEEEEDVLGYYKSWNHIIGGDLSAFQLTTGEYILNIREFLRHSSIPYGHYHPFIDHEASFKENGVAFKAFSQKKSDHPSHLFIEEVE